MAKGTTAGVIARAADTMESRQKQGKPVSRPVAAPAARAAGGVAPAAVTSNAVGEFESARLQQMRRAQTVYAS